MFHHDRIDGAASRSCPLIGIDDIVKDGMFHEALVPEDAEKSVKISFEYLDNTDFVNPRVSDEFFKHARDDSEPAVEGDAVFCSKI